MVAVSCVELPVLSSAPVTGPVQRPAGACAGMAAVVDGHHAVDDYIRNAFWKLMGPLEGGGVDDGPGIEHDQVGEVALAQAASLADAELVGGQAGHLADGFGQLEQVLLAHV